MKHIRGMSKTTTITINGHLYDAVTGMPMASAGGPVVKREAPHAPQRAFSDIGPRPQPVAPPRPVVEQNKPEPAKNVAAKHSEHPAQAVHSRPQKSETLYRKALKKPVVAPEVGFSPRSPLISRFGTNVTHHPQLNPKPIAPEEPIKPAQVHPSVAKALEHRTEAAKPQLSGQQLKEQLIKERLASVDDTAKTRKQRWFSRKPRLATILTTSLALLLLGGYITYMNLPMISMKVAASRAGVNATMPSYRPDGYNLDGPITYSPGQVNINYHSTTNDSMFKLTQAPSNWDSQAVLDNYVTKQTETYLTFQERGIKVYTFDNKAAWVNGGLFYTVDGTANLSSDQILRLATSM